MVFVRLLPFSSLLNIALTKKGFCSATFENQNKNLNLIEQIIPGIYDIVCIPKKKVYIGQSENLLAHFGKNETKT
jgi:hypothetical protein